MSTKSFKAIKSLSNDEIVTKLRETESDLFKTRMKHATGQLKETSELWKLRKTIARMKMLQSEHASSAKEGK